jgi:hypothetical protein
VSELLNLIGPIMGVVLYAVLLVMIGCVDGTGSVHNRIDPLLFVPIVLGLVWSLSALPVHELPRSGIDGPFLNAVGLRTRGFLPAVVVHSVVRGEREGIGGTAKLRNVERRLQCQYSAAANLSIQSTPGQVTTVEVHVPVSTSFAAQHSTDRVAV